MDDDLIYDIVALYIKKYAEVNGRSDSVKVELVLLGR